MLRIIHRVVSDSKCNHRQDFHWCIAFCVLPTCEPSPETWRWSPWGAARWLAPPSDPGCSASARPRRGCGRSSRPSFPEDGSGLDTCSLWRMKENRRVSYFNDAAQLGIADGELFVSLLGDNLLQHLLQTFANFPLDKGSGSCVVVESNNRLNQQPHPKIWIKKPRFTI